jgi:hypothetical protein
MDKVQKTIGSQYYTPSPEAFRIYQLMLFRKIIGIFDILISRGDAAEGSSRFGCYAVSNGKMP